MAGNSFRPRKKSELEILSVREDNIRIPKLPPNVLFYYIDIN